MPLDSMNKLADDYILSNGLVNYLYCFRNYLSDKPEIDELISNYPKESQRLSTAPVMATSDIAKKDAALLSHYDGEVVISHVRFLFLTVLNYYLMTCYLGFSHLCKMLQDHHACMETSESSDKEAQSGQSAYFGCQFHLHIGGQWSYPGEKGHRHSCQSLQRTRTSRCR